VESEQSGAKLLVIDDDRAVLRLVQRTFEDSGTETFLANNPDEGLELIRRHQPDVLLLDIMLPRISGIELAHQIREIDPKLPMIFITASDESDVAIEAMKLGAYEFLLKPLDLQNIRELVKRALQTRRLMQSPVVMQESDELPADGDALVGRSAKMLEVYKQIGRVAAQDITVLIRGESGTGKELIARAIYHHSHRHDGCFLAVNCAALSDTLLESELFGHEKGAFTGADRRHIGKFEQANNGTIFLDEIGDMSPLTQSKVLRLLQEKKFERVGGKETIEVDVRVISATNRPLEQMIKTNEFRLDLFHRLNAFEIALPPLRERQGDIEILINHFLTLFNRQLDKKIVGFSDPALKILQSHPWPGNIRELQSAIRKSILMATGPVIVPEFLPPEIRRDRDDDGSLNEAPNEELDLSEFIQHRLDRESSDLYAETLHEMERYLISQVLRRHGGNQSRAADQLGITRGSLRNKIRTLGISIEQVVTTHS
jgi:two-component system nitrogen regulation response regulator GlnG